MRRLRKLDLELVKAEDCMEGNVRGRMIYRDEAQGITVKMVTYKGSRGVDMLFKMDGDDKWYRDGQAFKRAFESRGKS